MLMLRYCMKKFVLLFLFLCCLPFCTKDSESTQTPSEINATITIISGNLQTGQSGTPLANPLVVQVTDGNRTPIADLDVSFSVVEGDGSIPNRSTITTDSNGMAAVQWIIGSSYNGIEVTLSSNSFKAAANYICAVGENPSGIHITRTIDSLKNVEGVLYEVTFYGNYRSDSIYQRFNSTLSMNRYFCSLFSVFGDSQNYLLGRSFDNPAGWECLTLLTRVNPTDGYASIAPMRLRDIGFGLGTKFNSLTFTRKKRLLDAVVNPPDGINEHGLVVALANVTPQPYNRDPGKPHISCVLLVRKILDHARTVEEAAAIAMQYNITSQGRDTLDIHAIVADATGRSIILEPADGEMKVIPYTGNFQVMTNSPIYNVSLNTLFGQCWRFRTIYERLDSKKGLLKDNGAINLLQQVGNQWTAWSAVYNITRKSATLAIDFNFDSLYDFFLFPLW